MSLPDAPYKKDRDGKSLNHFLDFSWVSGINNADSESVVGFVIGAKTLSSDAFLYTACEGPYKFGPLKTWSDKTFSSDQVNYTQRQLDDGESESVV